ILAVNNSDPYETLGAKVPERKLHNGVCQIILRTTTVPGEICVKAQSDGLKNAEFVINSMPCNREPHVEIENNIDSLVYFAKMHGQN
ncbi:MAG: hypothetical protein GX103_05825, partial [Bacteroidales bacterium]|nr:hypothetical protein [Bacteroidales bacterium]